ncbi:MAG: hypothetical protein FJ090_14085 [Deltaproteobacteria bacterium]|nr:hypothetical protein [Deltaproteobacteria bacterium]
MLPLLFSTAIGGCAAEVDVDLDDDGDGLLTSAEESLGTDPNAADSDGDGTADGVEFKNNTDPLDPNEYPYEGGWAIGACKDDINGEGHAEGEVSDDFAMMDQHGQSVHLYSFCDRVIYMVFAAFW